MLTPADFQVFCLLYGNYPKLHSRLLSSFEIALPRDVPVGLWCNQISEPSEELVARFLLGNADARSAVLSPDNKPKYKVMSDLFSAIKQPECTKKWVIWFDDDSYIKSPDWWPKLTAYLASKEEENVCYVGQCWWVDYRPGQLDFVKGMPWYTGKSFDMKKGKETVDFATGGYWLLRTDVLKKLDWPPVKYGLSHNGGDTLLGEAIRQQGLPFHKYEYGVAINPAKRRGNHEAPAGCTDKTFRRG